MKQVVFRNGQAIVEEVPAPGPAPGCLQVHVAFSCVSAGTETATLRSAEGREGLGLVRSALRHPEKVRQVLASLKTRGFQATKALVQGRLGFGSTAGYSCAGIVTAVGEGVEGFRAGDRVACAGGGYANHAEVVVVPENLAVRVPDRVDLLPAATVTLGAIALQGVRRAQIALGEWAGVIGLGFLGQITLQLLKAAGCRVLAVDLRRERVELARSLGADLAFLSGEGDPAAQALTLTHGHGLDAVILTAATKSSEPLALAMRLARRKGRIVVVGDVGLAIERAEMYRKELDLFMSTAYGPGRYDPLYEEGGLDYPYAYVRWTENRNMAAYLDLVAAEKVRLAPLLTAIFPVAEAGQAYQALQGEGGPLTAMLAMPDGPPPLGRRHILRPARPANRRTLRVAVVGAGGFAQAMHLPNLKRLSDRFEIRAIVARTGTAAVAVARQYEAAVAATDLAEILADPDIDAVMLCTRHHLHAAQAAAALRAGKHVFVEKPLAVDREELAALRRTIEELQSANTCPAFLVGFNRRFSPYAVRLRERIAARAHPFQAYYRMNAGAVPPHHWVNTPEGGGRAVGEACHILDVFRYLVGAPADEVQVSSLPGGTYRPDENFTATIRYREGSICTLLYTALGPGSLAKETLELFVDGGAFVLEDYRSLRGYGVKGADLATALADKGHRAELEAFYRLCRGEGEVPMTLEEMLETTELTFAIRDRLMGGEAGGGRE
jgi:predicted dehydrogenase/threonine dehydrogenase-like Zn-dependent dehydrogenase